MDPEGKGDGQELGMVEGGETIIRICCMRKESVLNKWEKFKKTKKNSSNDKTINTGNSKKKKASENTSLTVVCVCVAYNSTQLSLNENVKKCIHKNASKCNLPIKKLSEAINKWQMFGKESHFF